MRRSPPTDPARRPLTPPPAVAEACSQRTLQMLSSMFEKASVQSTDLPCVPKSHDDKFLR